MGMFVEIKEENNNKSNKKSWALRITGLYALRRQ
jgi:hypothetical protein